MSSIEPLILELRSRYPSLIDLPLAQIAAELQLETQLTRLRGFVLDSEAGRPRG